MPRKLNTYDFCMRIKLKLDWLKVTNIVKSDVKSTNLN